MPLHDFEKLNYRRIGRSNSIGNNAGRVVINRTLVGPIVYLHLQCAIYSRKKMVSVLLTECCPRSAEQPFIPKGVGSSDARMFCALSMILLMHFNISSTIDPLILLPIRSLAV